MPRRRYRLFTVCAVVIVFMLYRVSQNSWDDSVGYGITLSPAKPGGVLPPADGSGRVLKYTDSAVEDVVPEKKPHGGLGLDDTKTYETDETDDKPDDELYTKPYEKPYDPDSGVSTGPSGTSANTVGSSKQAPDSHLNAAGKLPELNEHEPTSEDTSPYSNEDELDEDELEDPDEMLLSQNPPAAVFDGDESDDEPWKIHWTKVPENFPVPEASIIVLPTGAPQAIPKVQYEFGIEPAAQKTERETRQKRVKAEIERAWSGYRKYAWNHDELSPVSSRYRDPFCGWAATLVDSLDTLWIAGLRTEFEDAVEAVRRLDFTWTTRNEIPVFETTIRYLGGLLAAYDVSGGHKGSFPILLDKAVELGEILMGIFDTPNRMPVLYYEWKPEYASQPHRARRVGIAELGTLSLEFTRLAQLTGKQKYYDGVARITDALVELQEAGTTIPGLFPQYLDASGCNRTATTQASDLSAAAQKQLDTDELLVEPEGYNPTKQSAGKVAPLESGQTVAEKLKETAAQELEDTAADKQKDIAAGVPPVASDDRLERRGDVGLSHLPANETLETRAVAERPVGDAKRAPLAASGEDAEWDCVPQGLVASAGSQRYHMGGAQDSAYEYFSKQYLLLGGLEPKYKKLHVDTVNAVNEWLLYSAMTVPDWDVLFPALVTTNGDPETDLRPTFEVTHLTCFIGGMYGLGGKIFGRDEDIETAKKLTDGCVWAYQSTRSGLMPETSTILPCPTLDKCEFNETMWWEALDPSMGMRDASVARWEQDKLAAEQEEAEAELLDGASQPEGGSVNVELLRQRVADPAATGSESAARADDFATSASSGSIQRRAAIPGAGSDDDEGSELPESLRDKLELNHEAKASSATGDSSYSKLNHDMESFDTLGTSNTVEKQKAAPPSIPSQTKKTLRPPFGREKPMSHKEFVEEKIARDGLFPGFVTIPGPHYILRPEAIESVWYMYRITGDPTWMDKGWTMFQATVRATRTEIANSAIDNVLLAEPGLKDEMESFWLAETLKYYYLLFSEPDVISLDDWVLNTEAHPFRRPT